MKYFLLGFLLLLTGVSSYSQVVPAVILAAPLLLPDTALLPIRSFTASQKDNKVLLRWKSDSLPPAESFYAVERSTNGVDFSALGVSKNTQGGWFEFADDAPMRGKTFYRVRLSTAQTSFYSEIIAANPVADISCKFYPNPVDKVLIVKSELGLEVQIADNSGKPLITEKLPAGLKVIDVSSLDPGIYVITLLQKETNKVVVDKLVKK